MKLEFGNVTINLLALFIFILILIGFSFIRKWGKELNNRYATLFFYFLISTFVAPLYSYYSDERSFELWFPIGFTLILLYIVANKDFHASKIKASLLGFAIAIFRLIQEYTDFLA
ncbi:hypothetical protein [Salirhabdus sp. Marseille-P4669]|uniref:hypothetical protein n=1 Tax=Salirhabdus sp. Marseille-P4669 TaxID=2042310 RepID=UPI000C7AC7D4|nr:hypothetical protein [Salirhabdus sp. Marseille-P4669]